jgi:hypothetical protein
MNPVAATMGLPRPRWSAGHYALAAAGIVVGAGLGVGLTYWTMRNRIASQAPLAPEAAAVLETEQQRRIALLQQLAQHVGNPELDPANRPMDEILLEIQSTLMGLESASGQWTPETEQAINEMLAAPGANPWRPRRRQNPVDFHEELEPDDNWELTYAQGFDGALQQCCEDATVVAFDQCVVSVLERIFPQSGSFMLSPGSGPWKCAARERARRDLTARLGPSELHVRALLVRGVGLEAQANGADFGQAVRAMAEHAWPTAAWDSPDRVPWQAAFTQLAGAALQG